MHIMYIYIACYVLTIMYDYMHMREVANMSKGFSLWFHYYDYDVQKFIRRQKSLVTFVDSVSRHFEGSQHHNMYISIMAHRYMYVVCR